MDNRSSRRRTSYTAMHDWQSIRLFGNPKSEPKRFGQHIEPNREMLGIHESEHLPPHLQYSYSSPGYDDFHKAYLNYCYTQPQQTFPYYGPPRIRQGHGGSCWRHIKHTEQPNGRKNLFIDGKVKVEDYIVSQTIPKGNLIIPNISSRPKDALYEVPWQFRRIKSAMHGC